LKNMHSISSYYRSLTVTSSAVAWSGSEWRIQL